MAWCWCNATKSKPRNVVGYIYSTKRRITNFKQRYMKQKMKILTTFTLITLLLFNSSCEKDLYEDAIQQNKDFKFKTVNFHEVKKINDT